MELTTMSSARFEKLKAMIEALPRLSIKDVAEFHRIIDLSTGTDESPITEDEAEALKVIVTEQRARFEETERQDLEDLKRIHDMLAAAGRVLTGADNEIVTVTFTGTQLTDLISFLAWHLETNGISIP